MNRPTLTGNVPRRGEIWLADLDQRRPVVILHRDFAAQVLSRLLCVPLTTTKREIPTNVALGPKDGVDRVCYASLDNLTLVQQTRLLRKVGELKPALMKKLCQALAVAVDCD